MNANPKRAGWRQTIAVSAVLSLLSLMSPAPSHAEEAARGKQVYKLCAACHGENGHGNQALNAPPVAGLEQWYVEAQLRKFKDGLRGYDEKDASALQMRPMARALTTDEDLTAVSAYVAGLTPPSPAATVEGDVTRGQQVYATCLACHGADGSGNKALQAPGLGHQADWYVVSQLQKFRDGLRGTHAKDATGAQMRALTLALDDQAIKDVATYIRTLAKQ